MISQHYFREMKAMDFVEPYLKSIFGFLGFTDISYFSTEGTSMLSSEVLEEKKAMIEEAFNESLVVIIISYHKK